MLLFHSISPLWRLLDACEELEVKGMWSVGMEREGKSDLGGLEVFSNHYGSLSGRAKTTRKE